MNKLLLILHTLRHLRAIQIRYQLWYRFRRSWRKQIGFNYSILTDCDVYPVALKEYIPKYSSFDHYQFTFLNQSVDFKDNHIDWNYDTFGKLWTYNLNYFDFLLQNNMDAETGHKLIYDFISKPANNSTALEPYPIALRGINWIKFLSKYSTPIESKWSNSLYAQYQILSDNLEYHLLANHLLEDGFSLLFGAFYFKDEKLYRKAIEILNPELNEQILEDGAHFELSPMYHQIMLDRLLDCINLVQNNQRFNDQEALLLFMKVKAKSMIEWLNCMTFSNGQIPLLNDSAPGIAPTTDQLNQYAIRLGILNEDTIRVIPASQHSTSGAGWRNNSCNSYLQHSGYRRFNASNYECILDIGHIGPTYQPGHAHADTFNFVLHVNDQPFIIDPGISTYEANAMRLKERGTASHNTVTIKDQNSSGVWSSFRVAHRANVTIRQESDQTIIAKQDGFRNLHTIHQREWQFQDNQIQITDSLKGTATQGKAHFWLAPFLSPEVLDHSVIINPMTIRFDNAEKVELLKVNIPDGYNQYTETYKLEIAFNNQLKTTLTIN